MNNFGGEWTRTKIGMLVDYTKAFLTVMKNKDFHLLYFDGFAGSGSITIDLEDEGTETIHGAALQVLAIDNPKTFDRYYFVELNKRRYDELLQLTQNIRPGTVKVVNGDCNEELSRVAEFLKRNWKWRSVIFIDPFGMQLTFKTVQKLKGVNTDFVILVPTGGANRLLRTDGNIDESWCGKLETFLGMRIEDIKQHFYRDKPTLFEDIHIVEKEKKAVKLLGELYQKQLKDIFNYVTKPYIIQNSNNSIMFHFFFASNNKVGSKIADHIVKKYSHGNNKY